MSCSKSRYLSKPRSKPVRPGVISTLTVADCTVTHMSQAEPTGESARATCGSAPTSGLAHALTGTQTYGGDSYVHRRHPWNYSHRCSLHLLDPPDIGRRTITPGNTLTMLAMASVMLAGTQARADAVRQPTMTRHQMVLKTVGCMRKRMSIDRAVSYNEALRTCRAQINNPSGHSSSAQPPAFASTTNP